MVPDMILNLMSVARGQQKIINFKHLFVDEVYILINILYYFFITHYIIFIII